MEMTFSLKTMPQESKLAYHNDSFRIGELRLHLLSSTGKMFKDGSMSVSMKLKTCTLDDLREGIERATSRFVLLNLLHRFSSDIAPVIATTHWSWNPLLYGPHLAVVSAYSWLCTHGIIFSTSDGTQVGYVQKVSPAHSTISIRHLLGSFIFGILEEALVLPFEVYYKVVLISNLTALKYEWKISLTIK